MADELILTEEPPKLPPRPSEQGILRRARRAQRMEGRARKGDGYISIEEAGRRHYNFPLPPRGNNGCGHTGKLILTREPPELPTGSLAGKRQKPAQRPRGTARKGDGYISIEEAGRRHYNFPLPPRGNNGCGHTDKLILTKEPPELPTSPLAGKRRKRAQKLGDKA